MQEIEARVNAIFRKLFRQPQLNVNREMTAHDVEGWDSLQNIRLMVTVEKEFGIKLKSSEVVALQNVGQMLDLIASKTTQPGTAQV